MNFKLESLPEKKLIGLSANMSFANHNPAVLWKNFIPRKNEIQNILNSNLFSLELYPEFFFENFNPAKEFQKWAAVEAADFSAVPDGMQTLTVPSGLYAVFTYKGTNVNAAAFYNQIFTQWLPASNYILDNRPHMAIMGEKYKKDSAESEEEIWIPVKSKIA